MRKLDRLAPISWDHVQKHPFTGAAPIHVEKLLKLPKWHWTHDQGQEGSCVGHGISMERAITNTGQNVFTHLLNPGRRYNPLYIWNKGKEIDEWPDTNPGDDNGTSVKAGYDVCRTIGVTRVKSMVLTNGIPTPVQETPVILEDGIVSNNWATTVDQMRAAIKAGLPVAIGVNWYNNFDKPVRINGEIFIGRGDLGATRGGHCVCIYGASDKLQAFRLKNSWGRDYPLVWLTYTAMERLLKEDGEAALVLDK